VKRKFLNKHLHFPIHDLHVFVHPPLVSKNYAPCYYHVRTFPVSLYLSFISHVGRELKFVVYMVISVLVVNLRKIVYCNLSNTHHVKKLKLWIHFLRVVIREEKCRLL
jgi:hypothetical protein